jgi:hypothetical protein
MTIVEPPPAPVHPDELEALIREARARQRRRQILAAAEKTRLSAAGVSTVVPLNFASRFNSRRKLGQYGAGVNLVRPSRPSRLAAGGAEEAPNVIRPALTKPPFESGGDPWRVTTGSTQGRQIAACTALASHMVEPKPLA